MHTEPIAILGAGSWGTAMAIHLSKKGHPVVLWGHTEDHVKDMQIKRCNQRYLPDIPFPASLSLTTDLKQCVQTAEIVCIAVPSHAFEQVLSQLPQPKHGLVWLTKGLSPDTHELLSVVVKRRFGENFPCALLSGPSFATELAKGLPTALTLASDKPAFQKKLHPLFHDNTLRVYLSHDLIGVQLCGAMKNVLAIACGISDGLQFGANAKAALITRGLAEMKRLGLAMGASLETFMSLAGLGDLVLTCTDNQSRNRRFGLALGEGKTPKAALQSINQVVEGLSNAHQVVALGQQYQVDLPICTHVQAVITGQLTPKEAAQRLMERTIGEA